MKDFAPIYRDFVRYKLLRISSYTNFIKKIRSLEDFKYAFGLLKFAWANLLFKRIDNERVRGR